MAMDVALAIRKECSRRGYSERTIESYTSCVLKFISFTGKSIDTLGKKDALNFLSYLLERKVAGNTMNVYHMAIRFFMEDILRKNMRLKIKYSKRPEKLPEVLTQEEIKLLIDSIKNSKHKLMISLIYGAGLRVSELLNLKVGEIDFENKYGFVRQGKGRKDRIFILPEKLIVNFKILIMNEKLSCEDYLFLTNRRERYSARTIAEIVKNVCKIIGINRRIHPHTLRHSFATHLIENGSSTNEVQTLLGHKSPETTMVYVHLARPNMMNIKSPLDDL